MHYHRVYVEAIGYELAPVVVTTAELEARLDPFYKTHQLRPGYLELMTGISERRWWEPGYAVSAGATAAARKALAQADYRAKDVDVLIYAGVCREQYEPATACRVAANLGVSPDATMFDLSNACLGVLNGVVEVANRIELGQARAGLVVSAETAREINDHAVERVNAANDMGVFRESMATFTGGSGAVAVLVTAADVSAAKRRRLVGGMAKNAPQHHDLCKWGVQKIERIEQAVLPAVAALANMDLSAAVGRVLGPGPGGLFRKGLGLADGVKATVVNDLMVPYMITHPAEVLKHGVTLGSATWAAFLHKFGWAKDTLDKVICHQVGAGHREAVLKAFGIDPDKDFSTFEALGNIGTVSLPLTAAVAEEREFLRPGDRVGWLGIGSGLNCLMLGLEY